jgi:hypothetical protein
MPAKKAAPASKNKSPLPRFAPRRRRNYPQALINTHLQVGVAERTSEALKLFQQFLTIQPPALGSRRFAKTVETVEDLYFAGATPT